MFLKMIELISTLLTVNKSRLVKHLIKHVKQKLSEPCLHYFWNNNYQKATSDGLMRVSVNYRNIARAFDVTHIFCRCI